MKTIANAANTMPMMPALPKVKKLKPMRECACGCGMGTRSTWTSGHDGRATGWAKRVMGGVMTIDQVPANERKGAEIMIAREQAKISKAS